MIVNINGIKYNSEEQPIRIEFTKEDIEFLKETNTEEYDVIFYNDNITMKEFDEYLKKEDYMLKAVKRK